MPELGDGERPAGSLLEGLVAAMPDAVVGTDAEFRVTTWNADAERLYGFTTGEALGRFARELSTLVGNPSHVELEEALVRDGRMQGELWARRGDGTIAELRPPPRDRGLALTLGRLPSRRWVNAPVSLPATR